MSESSLLSQVADLLRPVSKDVSNGQGKLCLSTVYLKKLNCAFDENVPEDLTSSFHLTDAKATLQRDLQFLLDLVKGTVALKVTPDLIENENSNIIMLKRFKNIKILEIHKEDVRNIQGIQRLRSQIQELTCMYNLECLSDILSKCGGDLSGPNLWSELKRANFSHNRISDIDTSLELTPWLNTLDLSNNHLTSVEFFNHIPNLKNLNLSYNKLEKAPTFKGPICKRLQILLLNNNFIEDLSGLSSVTNLSQLDLNQNCLVDHQCFLSISHMPSLYFLNLQGNPISFHPHHRTITCNYLNKNTVSLKFVLNGVPLNKREKSLAGSLYPVLRDFPEPSFTSSQNSLDMISSMEKSRKVRNVEIQDGFDDVSDDVVIRKSKPMPDVTSRISTQHLDVKNKIEQLRQEHGETWLARHSGAQFQEFLGFKKEDIRYLATPPKQGLSPNCYKEYTTNGNKSNIDDDTSFVTAKTDILSDPGIDDDDVDDDDLNIYTRPKSQPIEEEEEILSDDEEVCDGDLFFAASKPDFEDYDLSIIVTETHLSERDSVSCKEKARWSINVVKFCQPGDNPNEVQIIFETLRTDRKSRTYYMEEAEKFIKIIFERMIKNRVPEKRIQYQCIKCNESFSRTKASGFLQAEQTIACPKCGSSNMIIESK